MRKEIYLKIVETLSAATFLGGKLFAKFDLFNKNVDYISGAIPTEFPLCFVEFMPIKWRYTGDLRDANVSFRLHILTRQTYPGDNLSGYQNQALECFDIIEEAVRITCGISIDEPTYFLRKMRHAESVTNHNHNEIVESIECFEAYISQKL